MFDPFRRFEIQARISGSLPTADGLIINWDETSKTLGGSLESYSFANIFSSFDASTGESISKLVLSPGNSQHGILESCEKTLPFTSGVGFQFVVKARNMCVQNKCSRETQIW